jgi:hypothetical protein
MAPNAVSYLEMESISMFEKNLAQTGLVISLVCVVGGAAGNA